MFRQVLNWKTLLAVIAIVIVSGTIFYSQYLSRKIARDEKSRVEAFADALRIRATTEDPNVLEFTGRLASENKTIPIVETDERGNPTGIYVNLDSSRVAKD